MLGDSDADAPKRERPLVVSLLLAHGIAQSSSLWRFRDTSSKRAHLLSRLSRTKYLSNGSALIGDAHHYPVPLFVLARSADTQQHQQVSRV